jgi:hypothetical protein
MFLPNFGPIGFQIWPSAGFPSQKQLYLWFEWTDFDEINTILVFKKKIYQIHYELVADVGWKCGCAFFGGHSICSRCRTPCSVLCACMQVMTSDILDGRYSVAYQGSLNDTDMPLQHSGLAIQSLLHRRYQNCAIPWNLASSSDTGWDRSNNVHLH